MLVGIQQATREADHDVSIVGVPVATGLPPASAVARLRALAVDGILVVGARRQAITESAEAAVDIPLVAVACASQELVSAVVSDHYSGAAAATRHLLDLGHHTVFHIGGPVDDGENPCTAGWHDELLSAGSDVPAAMAGDWSPELGYELGRRLATRRDVTAIFAANDHMALGVLRALFEAGRRVPHDVSVVGFGGIPQGEFWRPPLTTVRQDFTEMGRRSLELLLAEIDAGLDATVQETIPTDLTLRASTAIASSRGADRGGVTGRRVAPLGAMA